MTSVFLREFIKILNIMNIAPFQITVFGSI